ncbi:neurotrypsin-like [Porites lutea]|uniref:neurotrypsin-like n=1 Tax=Porites lutea TaxID=51062 RepID=UPI003CC6900B
MTRVRCTGNEKSLTECYSRWSIYPISNCGHDAWVFCISARLVGGKSPREGLVQVYYNNTWGWVCADQWDKHDADVACRMMDFDGSVLSYFLHNVDAKSVNQANAVCQHLGYEAVLVTTTEYSNFEGGRSKEWMGDIRCLWSQASTAKCLGAARLVEGQSLREGNVQVYYNNTWISVCADQWDKHDADVACRMMDFDGALSANFEYEEEKEIKIRPWLSDMNCTGNEKSLFSCIHGGFGFRDCKSKRKAGVTCKPKVQLVGWGNVTFQGRVQMFYNGTWEEVCGNYWDLKDASVVCRQLGFPGALVAVRSSDFQRTDRKRGNIWIHNVHCIGNETALQECDHKPSRRSCYGNKVASLVCITDYRSEFCTNETTKYLPADLAGSFG